MNKSLSGWLAAQSTHKRLILVLALLLPFEYIPSYEIFGLRLRLSFIVGALIVLCAAYMFVSRKIKLKFYGVELLILGWLLWVILRSATAANSKAMLNIVLPLVFYVGLAFSVKYLFKRSYIDQTVKWLLIGAGLAATFGFYQFAANWLGAPEWATGLRPQYSWQSFGFPRLQSTALEPLYFSAYLLLPFAVLVSFMARSKNYRSPILIGLLMVLLLADILTLSRGGLVALVIELMILGIFYARKLSLKNIAYIGAVFGAVVLVCIGLITLTGRQGNDSDVTYGQKGVNTFISHLKNFSFFASASNKSNDDSLGQRDRARLQARTTLSDNRKVLLFGTGAGQYHEYNKKRYANPDLGEPNNVVLEQMVQFGVIGFGLLLAAGLALLLKLFRTVKNNQWRVSGLAVAFFAYFIALFLQAQTFTGLALTHLWFAVGLALFLVQYHSVKANKNDKTSKRPKI